MSPKSILRILLGLIVIALGFPRVIAAQGTFKVRVENLNNNQFPFVEAYVSVLDSNGLPLKEELLDSAFSLTEDGVQVNPLAIEKFQNKEQPLAIALLVDTSSSMGSIIKPEPLDKAVEAAKYFVEQLADQDQVTVIKFSETPEVVLGLTAASDNKVALALDSLQPEKSKTVLYDAIVKGVNEIKSFSGRRIIVVVTDGKDTGTGLFNFANALSGASAESIPVYPMGFGGVINIQEMKRMAELTGGVAQIQPSIFDLQASFITILDILREQYRISYVSGLPADNKNHNLIVAVDYQEGKEQASFDFSANPNAIPMTMPGLQDDQVIGGLVNFAPKLDWPAAIPITSFEIVMDGSRVTEVSSAPFSYEWNSTQNNVQSGPHDFDFKVTDTAGNIGQTKVRLNVEPPLTIELTSPANGSTIGKATKITANVTALSGITIARVDFLVDNQIIASDTTVPFEVDWDVTKYPAQTHPVSAIAYDSSGLFTSEAKISINVEVGSYSWMIPILVLAVAALIIPIALRSRRRVGKPKTDMAASAGSEQPVLREMEGLNPNQVVPLGISEVRLGRKRDENDIQLKGLNASRRQASIRYEQGQYVIYTLNSNNPALVNNSPVTDMQALKDGDTIRLGETVLRFEN